MNDARILTVVIACMLLPACSAPLSEKQPEDLATSLHRIAVRATEAYKVAGTTGLIAESRECYRTNGPTFGCMDYDIVASYIARTYPEPSEQEGYFSSAEFLQRARPVVGEAGWSMDTANAYLQFADDAARDAVDPILKDKQ